MREIWFWQRIVSPHMAGLARALARSGFVVTYVVERDLSESRKSQGWVVPSVEGLNLVYARDMHGVAAIVRATSLDSIHLCQGLRGNGIVSYAQTCLAKRGLRQWVLIESVDDDGWRGILKRLTYSILIRRHRSRTAGLLAIGDRTSAWLFERGAPKAMLFPFAYFLEDRRSAKTGFVGTERPFQFIFVGQFIHLKRLPFLVDSLAALPGCSAELVVVGSGPLEEEWRSFAERRLPGRLRWRGKMSSAEVLRILEEVDCLVLPSRYDGWGAVVSEALMSGIPAICSDKCGSATAVKASGVGGVFRYDDMAELSHLLSEAFAAGKATAVSRRALARWATSLGANAGAHYLSDIFNHMEGAGDRPRPPWVRSVSEEFI